MLKINLHKTLRGPSGDFRLEIDLSVVQGQVLALYGPSGAGKTTVLRMVSGLLPPDGGTLSFLGEDWTNRPAGKRNVGFVFQDYGLFPNMTVATNLAFAGGTGTKLAEEFELGDLTSRYPHQLSGGQQQRVAVARSLVQSPDILLLDEPLSALNRSLRRKLGTYLKKAVRDQNICCLLVSHDPEEILLLADRVAILNGGKISAIGQPADLLLKPATNGRVQATVLRLEANRMLVRVGDERIWVGRQNAAIVGEAIFLEIS